MTMTTRERREALKRILTSLKSDKLDVDDAATQLNKMFQSVETAAKKAGDAVGGAAGDDPTVIPVDVQFRPIWGNLTEAAGGAGRILKEVFTSYRAELQKSLVTTEEFIPKFNRLFAGLGDKPMQGFEDFKGMALDSANAVNSLTARLSDGLLKFYSYDEIKKKIFKTTEAFQETFPRIRFETKENEKAFFHMAMTMGKIGIPAREAGTFFQVLTQQAGATPGQINQVTNAMLQLSKTTGRPLREGLDNVRYFVAEHGYTMEQAVQASARLSIQSMKTGISVKELGNIFGDGMDRFDDLANKTAELNAVFGVSLNPQEMIDMTADERSTYVAEALKNSNADLNDRLLQKQIASVLGGEKAARKFLTGIQGKGIQATAAMEKAEAEAAKVSAKTQSTTTAGLEQQAKNQMSKTELLKREIEERRIKGAVAAAGGGDAATGGAGTDAIEKDATRGFRLEIAAQRALLKELDGNAGQALIKTVQMVRRAQALFGSGVGLLVGTADAVNITGIAVLKTELKAAEKADASERTARQKELIAQKQTIKDMDPETFTKKINDGMVAMTAALKKRLVESGMPEDAAENKAKALVKKELDIRNPAGPPGEAAAAQARRLAKTAAGAADTIAEEIPKNLAQVLQSLTTAVDALTNAEWSTSIDMNALTLRLIAAQGGSTRKP
jgi:hypothetical protein